MISKNLKKIFRLIKKMYLELCVTLRSSPFKGVYYRWEDVPQEGLDHQDQAWAQTAADHTRRMMDLGASRFISPAISGEVALLPLMAALSPEPIKVLDWGGATGFGFLSIVQGGMNRVEKYVVVDYPLVTQHGRSMFSDPRISFSENIPDEQFDVVVLGSSIQYAEDPKALLSKLSGARYMLLTKTPAGENVTYLTCQTNLPGKKHPYWILNVHELIAIMGELSYKLIFKSAVAWDVDQEDFEPHYRVERYCNILFERIGD